MIERRKSFPLRTGRMLPPESRRGFCLTATGRTKAGTPGQIRRLQPAAAKYSRLASRAPVRYVTPPCSTTSKAASRRRWRRNWCICGGFFDVPSAQKRLGELNSLMAADSFWNNREQAQKLIDESNSLRNKIEPLLEAERTGRFPRDGRAGRGRTRGRATKPRRNWSATSRIFPTTRTSMELRGFPERTARQEQLHPEHQRRRGRHGVLRLGEHAAAHVPALGRSRAAGEVEVTDALPGEGPASRAPPCASRARTPTAFARPSAASTAWCASRPLIPTSAATPALPAWTPSPRWRRTPRRSSCRPRNFQWTPSAPAARAGRT